MSRITPFDAVDSWLAIEQAIKTLQAFVYQEAQRASEASRDTIRMNEVEAAGITRLEIDEQVDGQSLNSQCDLEPGDSHYFRPRSIKWS